MSDEAEDIGDLQVGVTDDEAAEAPDEGTGPELITEPETEPAEEEPQEEPKEESKEDVWDRERQERDQQHAADSKVQQERIDALLDAQKQTAEQITALTTQLQTAKEAPEDEFNLSEESDVSELVEALKEQRATAQATADNVKKLTEAMAQRDTVRADEKAQQALADGKTAYKAHITSLEGEYKTKKYTGEAQRRAQEFFKEQGCTEDSPPSDLEATLALDKFFREARDEDKTRQASEKPTSTVALDTGTGGSSVSEPRRPMNDAQFKAMKRKQGVELD